MHAELVRPRSQVHRVVGRVRSRPGHDGRAVADLVDSRLVQREALVVGERRRLSCRACDDEPVGAVRDEVRGERAERLDVDRAVLLERRADRGQDLTQHDVILRDGRRGS